MKSAADQWVETLKESGYEHHCHSSIDYWKFKLFPGRIARKLIKLGHIVPNSRVVEFGCGGGIKLAPMALMGCETLGIDVSSDVLERARHFKSDLEQYTSSNLLMDIVEADILNLDIKTLRGEGFDAVFSSGVVEHFLEESQRISFLNKKFEIAKDGGWVITIVPSGVHPWRQYMRTNKLGGYNVPEIDYSPKKLEYEMQQVGLSNVKVIGYNMFGYLTMESATFRRLAAKLINYAAKIVLEPFAPEQMKHKHGYVLIAIGQKPI